MGRDLGRWGLTFESGAGPRWVDVQAWGRASAYDLCGRGEAAHPKEGLWSVDFQSLEVGL